MHTTCTTSTDTPATPIVAAEIAIDPTEWERYTYRVIERRTLEGRKRRTLADGTTTTVDRDQTATHHIRTNKRGKPIIDPETVDNALALAVIRYVQARRKRSDEPLPADERRKLRRRCMRTGARNSLAGRLAGYTRPRVRSVFAASADERSFAHLTDNQPSPLDQLILGEQEEHHISPDDSLTIVEPAEMPGLNPLDERLERLAIKRKGRGWHAAANKQYCRLLGDN